MTSIQQRFGAAFAAFMAEDAKAAIIDAARTLHSGSAYFVELFEDGSHRILCDELREDGSHRILCDGQGAESYASPGIILNIPQLAGNDEEHSFFDNALTILRSEFTHICAER